MSYHVVNDVVAGLVAEKELVAESPSLYKQDMRHTSDCHIFGYTLCNPRVFEQHIDEQWQLHGDHYRTYR